MRKARIAGILILHPNYFRGGGGDFYARLSRKTGPWWIIGS
jgi:hypothetical protein